MREEIGGGGAVDEMSGWKEEIIKNCHLWIESLPEDATFLEPKEAPDLYSFYEQLCVLKSELKKNARRTHETFSQFGDYLEEFQEILGTLRQRLDALSVEKESTQIVSRQKLFLQVVEIYERLRRFSKKLREAETPQQTKSEPPCAGFRERIIWRLMHRQESQPVDSGYGNLIEGFFLALSHFTDFLTGEDISRVSTKGEVFNPSYMIAVGIMPTDAAAPDMGFEEIEGGYMHGEQVLKPAKVTVTKRRGS